MNNDINLNLFFVRERPGLLHAENDCDILDPATGRIMLHCREEKMGRMTRLFRFTSLKRTTPFEIAVRTPDGGQVLRITRGIPVFASIVQVFDDADILIGSFKQKAFSISGAFDVLDAEDQPVCRLKGGQAGWNFRFVTPDDIQLASVTKKWAGLGKELFSSASDYMLAIDEAVPADSVIRRLILASALCIGLIQKIDLP